METISKLEPPASWERYIDMPIHCYGVGNVAANEDDAQQIEKVYRALFTQEKEPPTKGSSCDGTPSCFY